MQIRLQCFDMQTSLSSENTAICGGVMDTFSSTAIHLCLIGKILFMFEKQICKLAGVNMST